MAYDDTAEPSPSSSQYVESPHEAKRKALKEKLNKLGKKDIAEKQGADLQDLRREVLKVQVEKTADAKPDDEGKQPGIGTKTREQEIQSLKLTADTKPNTEEMAKKAAQQEKAEAVLKEDEAQGEAA